MRILLTVFSVYDTLENVDDVVFKDIIDKIKQIKEINNDDIILISFCDNTENKDVIMYYLRNITDDNEILIGRQFLNDVYYNNIINNCSIIYDKRLSKEQKIFNYIQEFIENKNIIDLLYIDNNIDIEQFNYLFSTFDNNVNIDIIKEKNNEIIHKLENLNKDKKLEI